MSEKLNTTPPTNREQPLKDYEFDNNIDNREFLGKHGRLQVAVYDFANHAVEKFKLARHDIGAKLESPKDAWRELAVSRAQQAHARAQQRVEDAKFSRIKDRRQTAADAAELQMLELETANDEVYTARSRRRQKIKQEQRDKRDINFKKQIDAHQASLADRALADEGLDDAERREVAGEMTNQQASEIGINALFKSIHERRRDKIDTQLESEADQDKIDQLLARREQLNNILDGHRSNLSRVIADALNAELPEPEPEPELADEFDQSDTEPATADFDDEPESEKLDQQPADGTETEPTDGADQNESTAEATKPEVDAEDDEPTEETAEQEQARLDNLRHESRADVIKKLEITQYGYSYSPELSDSDIEQLAEQIFGDKSMQMIRTGKTYGQWREANRDTWDSLSQSERDKREDAWGALSRWYKCGKRSNYEPNRQTNPS